MVTQRLPAARACAATAASLSLRTWPRGPTSSSDRAPPSALGRPGRHPSGGGFAGATSLGPCPWPGAGKSSTRGVGKAGLRPSRAEDQPAHALRLRRSLVPRSPVPHGARSGGGVAGLRPRQPRKEPSGNAARTDADDSLDVSLASRAFRCERLGLLGLGRRTRLRCPPDPGSPGLSVQTVAATPPASDSADHAGPLRGRGAGRRGCRKSSSTTPADAWCRTGGAPAWPPRRSST